MYQPITVCVVQDGTLVDVPVQYDPATGDTTYNGQPFATAFPIATGYAASATWFIDNEPIVFKGNRLVKYGLPRVLGRMEITRAGDYRGVPVFVEAGSDPERPEVVYLPVRPGCEFQPYQNDIKTGGVRG